MKRTKKIKRRPRARMLMVIAMFICGLTVLRTGIPGVYAELAIDTTVDDVIVRNEIDGGLASNYTESVASGYEGVIMDTTQEGAGSVYGGNDDINNQADEYALHEPDNIVNSCTNDPAKTFLYNDPNCPIWEIKTDDNTAYASSYEDLNMLTGNGIPENLIMSDALSLNSDDDALASEYEMNDDDLDTKKGESTLSDPSILAVWQMNDEKDSSGSFIGSDDFISAGAQFMPPGRYQEDKGTISCVLVGGVKSEDVISSVKTEITYPQDIIFSKSFNNCGERLGEFTLAKFINEESQKLVCDKLKNSNNNLLVFSDGLDYDSFCADDGMLVQGNANLYCGEVNLPFGSPAGDYRSTVTVKNSDDASTALEYTFQYVELTAFETDFTNLDYKKVDTGIQSNIAGDQDWETKDMPTVRNVGNTRLNILITQDDMGIGKEKGDWNISYGARVGSNAHFKKYDPTVLTELDDTVELSGLKEMDFYVKVHKFQDEIEKIEYAGTLTLGAKKTDFLTCQND